MKFCFNNFRLVCSYAFAPLGDGDDDEMDEFLAYDDEEDSDVEEFNMEKTKIRLGWGLILLRGKKTNTLISWCTIACQSFLLMFILMYICMKQESITVGCVPPWIETPQAETPWTETPRKRSPWTETPPWTETTPGQRHPL